MKSGFSQASPQLSPIDASPYRVRGQVFLGTRSFFEAQVAGGYESLLSALRPPLRAFMSQPFRPRDFYEVMVVPELIDMEAKVAGLSIARYLDQRTRFQALRDLSGAVALALRLMPMGVVISRVAASMTNTFNFGESEVTKVAPCHYHVQIRDVPQRLCAWLEHSVGVYGQTGLMASGARGVEVRSLPPDRGAHSTVHLHVDVRWQG